MARPFTYEEAGYCDRYFRYLDAAASDARLSLDLTGDGKSVLGIGPALRMTKGGTRPRTAFALKPADQRFVQRWANHPYAGQFPFRGLHLTRSATGVLIGKNEFKVTPPSGVITYRYELNTLRTTDESDVAIATKTIGQLAIQDGVCVGGQESTQQSCPPADFFQRQLNLNDFRGTVWATLFANMR